MSRSLTQSVQSSTRTATKLVRYLVEVPGQAVPASYNVGLGMKQVQFYATLTAKQQYGTIYSEDADGKREMIGSYQRAFSDNSRI